MPDRAKVHALADQEEVEALGGRGEGLARDQGALAGQAGQAAQEVVEPHASAPHLLAALAEVVAVVPPRATARGRAGQAAAEGEDRARVRGPPVGAEAVEAGRRLAEAGPRPGWAGAGQRRVARRFRRSRAAARTASSNH